MIEQDLSPEDNMVDRPKEDLGEAPGFSINETKGDIIGAPDRAVIVRECTTATDLGAELTSEQMRSIAKVYGDMGLRNLSNRRYVRHSSGHVLVSHISLVSSCI